MADYANDVLVSTDWVAEHLDDDSIRIVEVDENPALYAEAHIPGAIGFDWKGELQDQVKRDFLGPEEFGALIGSRGISNDHTIVLYGDRNNWFAAYTFWYLLYYGHDKARLMNGPRDKWIGEGRETSDEVPSYPGTTFTATGPDESIRARRDEDPGRGTPDEVVGHHVNGSADRDPAAHEAPHREAFAKLVQAEHQDRRHLGGIRPERGVLVDQPDERVDLEARHEGADGRQRP